MQHAPHRFAATRAVGQTGGSREFSLFVVLIRRQERHAGVKGDAFPSGFGRGMTEPKMPHGLESPGQHMPEVTLNKLHPLDRLGLLNAAVLPVLPGEGDMGVGDRADAGVADGGAADVGPEVFDDVLSAAKGLKMHAPVPVPDLRINGRQITFPGQLIESLLKAFAKGGLRHGFGSQEGGRFDGDDPVVPVDARAGNDGMKVGMEEKSLVPGVQDQGEAGGARAQGTVMSQRDPQCMSDGLEEDLVNVPGKGSEEEWTQFCGQGEGDHEIGSANALIELAANPLFRIGLAALGTAAMVAGMEAKLARAARFTGMQVSAHRRGAAMLNRPGGASLGRVQRRIVLQKLRQEPTQRLNDRVGHREKRSTGKSLAEVLDQLPAIVLHLMGQVEIDHGGVDLLMTQQFLDRVNGGSRLDEMGGEGMSQGVNGGFREVQFLARDRRLAATAALSVLPLAFWCWAIYEM
jgi:hypothetical protein